MLKGARGVGGRFSRFVVSYSGEQQLPGTSFGMKKYCSWPKLLNFQIAKIRTITLRVQTLNAIPRKSTLKFIFSYIFWDNCLKLRSYVLGTKTKLLRGQNFDLGLKKSKVTILNFESCQRPKILQKWALANFKIQYFHSWGLNQNSGCYSENPSENHPMWLTYCFIVYLMNVM